ncbi:hypothetical protein BURPSPAST_AA0237 [Burkholderia pseudomallei Pasteur 52237]|nr:hypothetical protein BURPSPAST_AA0237 [Burkholderia pseudomallei Pasteur 52237]
MSGRIVDAGLSAGHAAVHEDLAVREQIEAGAEHVVAEARQHGIGCLLRDRIEHGRVGVAVDAAAAERDRRIRRPHQDLAVRQVRGGRRNERQRDRARPGRTRCPVDAPHRVRARVALAARILDQIRAVGGGSVLHDDALAAVCRYELPVPVRVAVPAVDFACRADRPQLARDIRAALALDRGARAPRCVARAEAQVRRGEVDLVGAAVRTDSPLLAGRVVARALHGLRAGRAAVDAKPAVHADERADELGRRGHVERLRRMLVASLLNHPRAGRRTGGARAQRVVRGHELVAGARWGDAPLLIRAAVARILHEWRARRRRGVRDRQALQTVLGDHLEILPVGHERPLLIGTLPAFADVDARERRHGGAADFHAQPRAVDVDGHDAVGRRLRGARRVRVREARQEEQQSEYEESGVDRRHAYCSHGPSCGFKLARAFERAVHDDRSRAAAGAFRHGLRKRAPWRRLRIRRRRHRAMPHAPRTAARMSRS